MSSAKALAKAGIPAKRGESVRVVVRVRPLGSKEVREGRQQIVDVDERNASVSVRNPNAPPGEPPKVFTFDATYGSESTQIQIYEKTAAPIIESVIEGYNGTIFAYGQTGAGKSHTMEGFPDPPHLRGIIPNSFKHIFDKIGVEEGTETQFLVRASYLEIYNEEIRDLLSKDPRNKLELRESVDSGVYVKDLTSVPVKSVAEIDHVLQAGKKNRSVGATAMNERSSRSHSIFTIVIESSQPATDGEQHIRVGKLNLVDLAGSERQSKTHATGDRLKEAIKINQSLSALGNVISALVDGKSSHVPYRDSKLTRLLQDSLGGNTKTVMCANCGPADYNYDETLSTLRYANRAKNIKNKPRINEDPKDAMLREFQEEIVRLRQQLEQQNSALAQKGVYMPGTRGGGAGRARGGDDEAEVKVVEKVVEKVVVERDTEAELRLQELREQAAREEEELKRKTKEEAEQLREAHKATLDEKRLLEERLQREEQERQGMIQKQEALARKLKVMQAKLLVGGQMMDKAAKQEQELRRARIEIEEQRRQEMLLARELAETEETNVVLEEQYADLREEVESKTKKLKRLWTKYQVAATEVKDLQREFQKEREDMLDTIRALSSQLKLKQLVLEHSVPPSQLERLADRARWDDSRGEWIIYAAEHAGNRVRKEARSASSSTSPSAKPAHKRRPDDSERSRGRSGGSAGSGAGSGRESAGGVRFMQDAVSIHNPYLLYDPSQPSGFVPASTRPRTAEARIREKRPKTGKARSKRK